MEFGDRLKQERKKRKLTQQVVADELNVSRQTISSWETENSYPDIDSLLRLSDYYQISLDTLLKEDVGMTEYLKKQEVIKGLKPVTWVLTLIDVVFLAILVGYVFDVISLNRIAFISIFAMGMLNSIALIFIAGFQDKISRKPSELINDLNKYIKPLYWIIPSCFVLAIVFFLLNQLTIMGFFSGLGFTSLLVLIMFKIVTARLKKTSPHN